MTSTLHRGDALGAIFVGVCSLQTGFALDLPVRVGQFLQEVAVHRELQAGLPAPHVLSITKTADGAIAIQTDAGWAVRQDGQWQRCEPLSPSQPTGLPPDVKIHQVAEGPSGQQAAATSNGIFERNGSSPWMRLRVEDDLGRLWAEYDVRAVAYDAQGRLWFGTRAGVGCRQHGKWRFYEGSDGLPYSDFSCAAAGEEGSVWFGTRKGAMRFQDGSWAYRQGPRWLPHDEVRSIEVEPDGTAWFATAGGVGCIRRKPMTLGEKAAYYEEEIDRLIKRTPFGYVSEALLEQPGDKSQPRPLESDNDGLWTAMYGASQCYAYAVTGSEISKQRARQAFEALRFLQTVTQGGEHSPPQGYVARTVLPSSAPDPNVGRVELDRRVRAEHDRLWKVYQPRWPKSADGKWYWKSDTSSDELDGHYFFYPLYYDLVAQTEDERAEVRHVICNLTDHLIDHDFVLEDHDGRPTRWAIFRPSVINHDFNWINERGLNSLSMLSYLAVAYHVSADPRYQEVAEQLVDEHTYDTNLMVPKMQQGIGSGNQSDDEMAFMSFYNLLKYGTDRNLKPYFLAAFYRYWMLEEPERNPFFHFAYAAFGRGESIRDSWSEHDLSPWDGWLEDSLETLKGFPLDRVNWPHQNSHRLDLIRLPKQNSRDTLGPDEVDRGYRVDGKVLPVEERFFSHWNTDPYRLDYPGNGRTLAPGSVYLLPYYMGRYHGFIEVQSRESRVESPECGE